jgi:hypothetical protein
MIDCIYRKNSGSGFASVHTNICGLKYGVPCENPATKHVLLEGFCANACATCAEKFQNRHKGKHIKVEDETYIVKGTAQAAKRKRERVA